MKSTRTLEFRRNNTLEALLNELNNLLVNAEHQALSQFEQPTLPAVFIVGCPRSGTTLLMQWLAGSGQFAYPSNLISRFYQAPYIGARIQQMLVDPNFAFKNEMAGITSILADDYQSDLGKTAGPLAPNEFWYFWRRFFPYGEIQYLSEQELSNVDTETFLRELAALEAAFDKPLILKGLIANWNLPFLAETLEKALFLYIRRDPFFTIQSLLQSRLKFFGTLDRWYSLKPPEYERLQELDPFHQVAGQVFFTNQAIQQGLQLIAPTRWIEVDYENFCSNPKDIWQLLNQRFYDYGYKINPQAEKSVQFESQNRITIAPKQQEKVIAAYRDLFQIDITPTSQSVSTP